MSGNLYSGKIGVIGAGALGALYGARMARAGADVHFLLRSDYDAVKRDGLHVQSFQGDFTIHPPVYRTPVEMGRCDLVIVGLKSTDNAALQELLGPITGPETVVLTLQNGLGNEERIAEVLASLHGGDARDRVMGGVAFLCSNRIAPGVIHHIEYGHVRLAEFVGGPRERTHAVARLFEAAEFGCEVAASVPEIRWAKLVWNVPFNGMGVAAGYADSKVVMQDDTLRSVARGLMEEVIAGARGADGVEIPPAFIEKMFALTETMGPYRSSMQIDYENGRPLEVEAIIGEPLRRCQRAGVPAPRMELLYGILQRLDALARGKGESATKE